MQRSHQEIKKKQTLLAQVIDRTDCIADAFRANDVKDAAGARCYGGSEEIMAKGRGVKVKEAGS